MSTAREKLQQARIIWLTKAVRGLLKQHFTPKLYAQLSVGEQDAMLTGEEALYAEADKNLQDFLKEPDEAKAMKMLETFLGAPKKK